MYWIKYGLLKTFNISKARKKNKAVFVLCVFVLCRTVPLLEGGPLHVDVGFVRQVDLAGSFENSPRLVHTLRLQVLSVLDNAYKIRAHVNTHRNVSMLSLNTRHAVLLTLVQNSSYRAQAIRQRS